ncbi:unnamed protein product [Darwinula stevensoni]|uniref:Uncharacterized protein n=1 Tax=Darwinula stevensoni TaxID=69355 RepID=A0A7R9AG04_9CRUS|nr:unnamed protein product [Darwinula stevensoni]CAG0903185.1 unnamed protein product [Darwinula stevensoni]
MDEGDDDETYRVGESLGLRDTGSNRNTKPEYNTDGSHELTVTVTAQPPPPKAEHRMTGNQQFIMSDGGESWKGYDQRHKDHEDMLPVGMQELLEVPTTSGVNGEVGGTANSIQAGSIQLSPQQQYQLVSSVIWQGSNALIVQDGRLQVNGSENGGAMYTAIPVQAQAVPTSQPSATSIPNEKSKLKASRKKKTVSELKAEGFDPCKLEDNPAQVQHVEERFGRGCECQEENCFRGLNADFVYRHRLNIAELSKAEHDMYLMGVTMACLQNPEETVRHKERKRLRAQYVFHGKKVCLDAFLYLENTTHYQVKRIRKHVMTHGVTARVHGNHGKKPHNTFSLDSYQHATAFLQTYVQRHLPPGRAPVTPKSKLKGKLSPIYLPSDITRKKIHAAYKEYCEHFEPAVKVMGYSTFRYFMKDQFPHVRFLRLEATVKRDVDPGGKTKQNSNDVKADSNPVDVSDPVGTNSFAAQTNYVMAAVTAPAVTQNVVPLTPATNVAPTLYTYTATPLTGHTYVLTPVPPAATAPLHPPPPYSSCQIPEQTDPILEHLPPMRTTPPPRPPTPPTRTQDAQTWM